MADTNFRGPVWGAVQPLIHAYIDAVVTSQTNSEIYEYTVEANNDFYAMSAQAYATGAGSVAATVDIKAAGVSILTAPITLVTNAPVTTNIAIDSGETNGKKIPAGTSITVLANTGATTAPADVTVVLVGYRRSLVTP
jgi:Neuraminidase (sialidase)